jgi:hypothetical protein
MIRAKKAPVDIHPLLKALLNQPLHQVEAIIDSGADVNM